jgi:hypothetical protein
MQLRDTLWNVLGFGAFPLWLAAGGADWICHRRSSIERTSGPAESALHLLLFGQIAIPVVLALWLEITAALLAIMAGGVLAHLLTSLWDTSFAQPRRYISPLEQLVHSWLEMLPLFALVVVAVLHLDQLLTPRWIFESRAQPVPTPWRNAVLLGFAAGAALIIEEFQRGLRHRR